MIRALVLLLALLAAQPAAAAPLAPEATAHYGPTTAPLRSLLVRGTTDIALFAPVLRAFAEANPGMAVGYEQWGSNPLYEAAAKACTGRFPVADLIISSAVDQQVKLVNDGCSQPHHSAAVAALPDDLIWRDEVFGITREPAVMVYNRTLVPPGEAPHSRFDLLDLLRPEHSRYAGRVATYDIEASGLGYLFAFADSEQATTFGQLIEAFGRTRAVATCCSAEIIDGVISGRYLIAYNVLGSYALERAAHNPELVVVAPEDYTLMLSRAALIPSRAKDPAGAGRLVDFLLSPAGRRALSATHLIVSPSEIYATQAGGDGGTGTSLLRPIPLSPVLLVGLDRQRRAQFIALWRKTFGEDKTTFVEK
ncbi:ABC transporter substrate-binding protein [Solirhodobacter olei]|uniref:ABC transporter substrate-binding protein n=1 Tax=Solirhodobacter olei TaxID=2493082 RepID=UPI000FDBA093|nr:ABC transporter substrate-binding protein [Solirhodobacter olei]